MNASGAGGPGDDGEHGAGLVIGQSSRGSVRSWVSRADRWWGRLVGYSINASMGWVLVPPVLVMTVLMDFTSRGRPWAGDWVMAMTWTGLAVQFSAVGAAGVAAHDAGQALTGERAGVLDSMPSRLREVVRIWVAAIAPFAVVHLLAVAAVVVMLVFDGAPRGQVVAPLAQQLVVLGFAGALGVVVGAVTGPRLGAFVALVLATYLVYWRGGGEDDSPPTRVVSATASLVGLKLSEPLVAVQVGAALLWIFALLLLVVFSRPDAQGQRRPRLPAVVVSIAVMAGTGAVVPQVTRGWQDPVPTAVSRRCSGATVRVCLFAGHDGQLARVVGFTTAVHDTAAEHGLADLFPTHVTETAEPDQASGQIDFIPDELNRDVSNETMARALLPGQACPQISSAEITPTADAFADASYTASQTVIAMAADQPTDRWPLTPAQLRTFVTGAATCDIATATSGIR